MRVEAEQLEAKDVAAQQTGQIGQIEQIVQTQLDAYNSKDVAAWLATYADDAAQYSLEGEIIARDKAQMAANMVSRFAEPDLHATLLSRHSYDNVVIDHERVTRNFPEGPGTIEMLCIYLIEQGLIARASFKLFNKRLTPR
ncbi:nuclear transport factor 2 family protein [Aeromonas media]|uniref:nuclear transport factor 2 family protein n=1 Tax=Aeromonas media TaxID=651 RepID=UPI000DCF940F|nr:nuclear transport factor 2 family protein [Aeromonas media]